MASQTPSTPISTTTKVVVGAGAAALLAGLLGAFGGGKAKAPPRKPLSGCGRCGR